MSAFSLSLSEQRVPELRAFRTKNIRTKSMRSVSGWCPDGNILVLVRSLKSRILSSTSFQMGKTFWGLVSAAVEQSRRKANMVAQGNGKFGPWGWPQDPSKPKEYEELSIPPPRSTRIKSHVLTARDTLYRETSLSWLENQLDGMLGVC